jgi:hypothetical protein
MTTKFAGDTWIFDVTVVDADGAAYDITGATFKWALSRRAYGAPIVVKYSTASPPGIAITDAPGGVLRITVSPADTEGMPAGRYYHEIEMTESDGTLSTVLGEPIVIAATTIRNV